MSVGKFFKSVGHSVSQGSKSITHVVSHTASNAANTVKKSVSTVYNDAKSATSYAGKHLIGDVDSISSMLSSPILYIAIGGIVLIYLMKN